MIIERPTLEKGVALMSECSFCGRKLPQEMYLRTRSPFFSNGRIPFCKDCLKGYLRNRDFSWEAVNKLCQYMDIPFVPREFENLKKKNGEDVFPIYAEFVLTLPHEGLDWEVYDKEFRRLRELNLINQELPEIKEDELRRLKAFWGSNYTEEELRTLDNLYQGILASQNVIGALQVDQAKKLCKISLEIESCIRAKEPFDKLLGSYDKIVKLAGFTPKNVKNAGDFDSVGELFYWLEKKGWKNKYYDNVTKDIVDETIKNIQLYNRKLYTDETGIGDEIERRIEILNSTIEDSNLYDNETEFDLDNYEVDCFTDSDEDIEFAAEVK